MNRPRTTRKMILGSLETLDERIVPSGTGITSLPIATQEAFVTTRAGNDLGAVFTQYENFQASGSTGTFTPTLANAIYTSGTSVGVDITLHGGDFNTELGQLQGIGMQVTATSATTGTVEGYLPISQLPVVASNGYATSITPVYKPVLNSITPNSSTSATEETLVNTRGGQVLGAVFTDYINYEQAGASGTFTTSQSSKIFVNGTSVGVDIRFSGGDFNTLVSQLKGIGMQVTGISTQLGIVEGYLPIAQLPVVANNGYVSSLSPVFKPALN